MKLTFTHLVRNYKFLIYLLSFIYLTQINNISYAQTKIYANSARVISAEVDNPNNAINGSFATVKSNGGLRVPILGTLVGNFDGELELQFPSTVAANQTTFMRIDFEPDLLNVLLGGNLGNALANTVGGLVLGNHSIEVGARNGNATVTSGSSSGGFSTNNVRLVKDAAGLYYVAITPTSAYDRVYIKDVTKALLLGGAHSTKVYGAFYVSGSGSCDPAFATDFDGTGLTSSVLGVGKAGVTNMQYAIDNNPSTYSELSLGLLGVAGSISQNIYFDAPSNNGDAANVKLSVSEALINAGILNRISINVYNGNNFVTSFSDFSLLELDLLGLLNSGQPVNISIPTNAPFDRVTITLSSLLNVNLTQTVNVYGVTRSAGKPTLSSPNANALTACYNSTVTLGANTASTNQLLWYDAAEGGTLLATKAYNESYITAALTANKTFYVAARRIGCSEESARVAINVTVNPAIVLTATTFSNATVGTAFSKQITPATGGSPGFTYAIASGSTLPAGLTLSNAGLLGGTPTADGDYTFGITVTDSKNCKITTNYTLKVIKAITIAAQNLPNGTVGVLYPTQTLPLAVGGTSPYTYTATNLPPGLVLNATTREITGTPTTSGTFVIPVKVTDTDGNTITRDYTIIINDALSLPVATLADGSVNIAYPTQTIPSAIGGTPPYNYTASNLPPGLNFNITTREITGTPTTAGTYVIPITVSDSETKTATREYTIKVLDALTLPSKTLADGTVGTAYVAETLPAAVGGVGPYTYLESNLPPGFIFNRATRQLTGNPTQAGNYTITITAKDSENRTVSNTYALKVIGNLSLATATLPDGFVGDVYPNQTLPAVSGGTGPYNYVASNLPPGISFNATTRVISGTPTLGGNFTFSIRATDASSNVVNTDYSLSVKVKAPVVASSTTCIGTSATLTVTASQTGITYNWYGSTGSTPLSTNNNGTYITPIVNANTTFYVEAVSGTAISNKIAVNVNINPAPNLPTITTNNQVINSGQNTTIIASADAGNTINWYNVATGGTILFTGNTFTTPNLSSTTTYYVESVNASGCKSNTRVPVTVTVNTSTGSLECNVANAQNTGITGICALCLITGPGNSTDADRNNFTRISLTVGIAATGYQRLIFPSSGLATDSIRLDLATPTGLLDLSVLSGISIKVMNGASVVKTYQLNSSLIYLQVLGGNRFRATLPAGEVFDRVEVSFSALVAALSSIDIYGAEIIYPKPTIATTGQNLCSGNSTTLTATPNGGTTFSWFSSASGGTALATGNSFTTPVLTATTIYYIQISRNGCANPERVPVTVNVVPVLAVPVVANANVSSCSGSPVTISVTNPVATITYRWYEVATGGTLLFSGATFVTPALTTNKIYYVEASKSGCVSATRTAVNITIGPRPVLPQIQASASTIPAGQTAILTATSTDTNVDFLWYTSANATTAVYIGPTYVTPPLTTTTTYFVEAKSKTNACTSLSRVSITINVDNGGSSSPVPCEAALAETNGVDGVALLSGVINPGLAIDNNTQSASTLLMPVGALNASVYQRLSFGSLSNIGDTVKVLITSPGKLLSLSLLGSVQLTTYNGTTSNADAISLNNALISLELLSGSTQALLTFVPAKTFNAVEIRLNSGLVGALTSLGVNYAQHIIAAPEVTASSVSACLNQTATLSVKNPKANLTYKWYDAAGIYQTGKDGTSFITPAITANIKYFVAATSSTGCISYKTVINVTVSAAPVTPVLVSANVTTCSGADVVLQIKDPVAGVTYKWYNAAGVYQTGKDGISFTVIGVTANTTYSVEAVNSCNAVSTKATANINVGALDTPIVTPASVSISSGSVAVLNATSSSASAIIRWYATATSTTVLHTGNTFVTPTLTQTTTYYVEASVNGGCSSTRVPVVVTVVTDGTPGQTPCGSATVALADGVSGVALLAGVFNPSLAVDNKIETGSSLVIPVGTLGAYVYQRVGFTGGLSNVGDTLRIRLTSPGKLLSLAVLPSISVITYKGSVSNNDLTVITNPLISLELLSDNGAAILSFVPSAQFDGVEVRLNSGLVGALTSVNLNYAQRIVTSPKVDVATATACQGSSAILSVRNPVNGVTYKWYLENVYQTGKDGNTFTTPTTLTAGTYNYFVTASANGCESQPTKVEVTILAIPLPPVPSTGNPTTGCFGTPITLSVQQVAGITYKWYNAAGSVLVVNNNSYTTPADLAVGTYDFFVEAVNGTSCASSTRTKITISVGSAATSADIQVTGTTTLCGSATATLNASTTTVTNPVFTWYSNANLTTVVHTGAVFTTPVLNNSTTYYVTVKGSNKCENKQADAKIITVIVNPVSTSADIDLSGNTSTCQNNSSTLTASTTTVTNPVFTWYSDANLTNQVYVGPVFVTPVLTTTTTYYVTVKGDNRCENLASTAKSITITISAGPLAPIVSTNGTSICAGSSTMLTVQNVQTGVIYRWFADATTTTILFTGSTFITPVLNATTDYYVSAVGTTGCTGTSDRVKVTVTVTTKPANATIAATTINGCLGSTAVITISNPVTGVTYSYYSNSTGGTALGNGNSFTTPVLTGNITYYVEASAGSCTASSRTQVNINASPTPSAPTSIAASNNQLCSGGTVILTVNNPDANLNYRWYNVATGGPVLFEGNPYTTPVLTTTTTFYVESISRTGGCPSNTRASLTVTVNPVLATPLVTVQTVTNTSILFAWNAVTGATGYEVSINNGTTWLPVTSTTYLVSGLQPAQNVTIVVRAKGQLGCQTSTNSTPVTGKTDDPLGNELYIPNTFTPNGDGKNDVFLAYGNSVVGFKMRIYNQWGQFVTESQSISQGWDGTFKGAMQPSGVYVYQIEATFNGGVSKKYKGTITLLR